jgi:tetratricopeptide (TPR) repeat protein
VYPRTGLRRLLSRLFVLSVFALVAIAAAGVIGGDARQAVVALLALALVMRVSGGGFTALAACLLLGEWASASAVALAIACGRLDLMVVLSRRRVDPAALSEAVAALPRPLHRRLRLRAGSGPITTWHAVDLARTENPQAWRPVLGEDPGPQGFDGPVVGHPAGGSCTQFFAEATSFAAEIAAVLKIDLDTQTLAAASSLIAPSIAHRWVQGSLWEAILRTSPGQLHDSFSAFCRRPAASGFVVRGERALALPPGFAAALSPEQLTALTRKQVVSTRFGYRLLYVRALGVVVADGVTALLRAPRRRRRSVSHERGSPGAQTVRAKHTRRRGGWAGRLKASWADLPPLLRTLWLLVRPALAIVAVAAAILIDHAAWWTAALAPLSVLAFRGLRTPIPALVSALAIAALAPVTGALLTVRVLLGEGVILVAGGAGGRGRRSRGALKFERARRRLVGVDEALSHEEARSRLEAVVTQPVIDHEDALLAANARALVAWSQGRPALMARSLFVAAKGGLTGHWEGQTGPADFAGEFRRLFIRERTVPPVVRLVFVLVALGATAVVVGPVPTSVAAHGKLAFLPAEVAALALTLPASRPRPAVPTSVVIAVAVWLLLPKDAVEIVAIAASCAIATGLLRERLARTTLEGRGEEPWAPLPKIPRRARRVWEAAEHAAGDDRVSLAIEMLDELARREAPSRPALAAECHARIALWQLDRGALGEAARQLDMIATEDAEIATSPMSAAGNYAVGMLSSHLGDELAARESVQLALRQAAGRQALSRRIALSLAELHARCGDAESALRVLHEHPLPTMGSAGIAMVIDREVVAASALARGGDGASALVRIEEVTRVGFSSGTDLWGASRRAESNIASAEARAHLLAGRLRLQAGEPSSALAPLDTAIRLLSSDSDAHLRASAQVLYGRALSFERRYEEAVEAVRTALATLESRREQVTTRERRTALIVAGDDAYEQALATFEQADRAGHPQAGLHGFALLESLRRSAISSMLRKPREEFRTEVNAALRKLDFGVFEDTEPAQVKARLDELISTPFANAFLPMPVDPANLQRIARRYGHVLAFYVAPAKGATWRGWMTPSGDAHIRQVHVDTKEHVLARLRSASGFAEAEIHGPWEDCGSVWRDLGDSLLPEQLRRLISLADANRPVSLLVVPDGYLAGIPWGALDLGGAPLLTRALVQVVPTVDLVGATAPRKQAANANVLAFGTPVALRQLEHHLPVHASSGRRDFVSALDRRSFGGAYIGTHGESTGLDQRVQFGDGSWLSAAGALMHPWPNWVIFAACVVGRIDPQAGGEPLGLPISCMLGGSSSVIAAVVRITGADADELTPARTNLFVDVARNLADDAAAASALRRAQLDYLARDRDLASVGDGLGVVCISTQAPAL